MFTAILNNAAKGTFLKAPMMSLETKCRFCLFAAWPGLLSKRASSCYMASMRNITIALDDDDYFRVEREAERKNTSVTEFAKAKLIEASAPWTSPVSPEEFRRLERLEAELRAQITDFNGSDILSRDELYDRARFR